jgi:hypothetical protein
MSIQKECNRTNFGALKARFSLSTLNQNIVSNSSQKKDGPACACSRGDLCEKEYLFIPIYLYKNQPIN